MDSPLPTRTPRQRQTGQSVYSDLLGPPPEPKPEPTPAATVSEARSATEPPAAGTGHLMGGPPAPDHHLPEYAQPGSPSAPVGFPPGPEARPPGPDGYPGGPESQSLPQQRGSADPTAGTTETMVAGGGSAFAPVGSPAAAPGSPGGPPPDTPAAPPAEGQPAEAGRSGPPMGVIVGAVLISAALLVLIALSIPLLLQHLRGDQGPEYALGDCVVQDGLEPRPVDCSEPDAFEIVSEVSAIEECPDYPRQNAIRVDSLGMVYCLDPVGEAGSGDRPDEAEE